jgi:hypothetical protein
MAAEFTGLLACARCVWTARVDPASAMAIRSYFFLLDYLQECVESMETKVERIQSTVAPEETQSTKRPFAACLAQPRYLDRGSRRDALLYHHERQNEHPRPSI